MTRGVAEVAVSASLGRAPTPLVFCFARNGELRAGCPPFLMVQPVVSKYDEARLGQLMLLSSVQRMSLSPHLPARWFGDAWMPLGPLR